MMRSPPRTRRWTLALAAGAILVAACVSSADPAPATGSTERTNTRPEPPATGAPATPPTSLGEPLAVEASDCAAAPEDWKLFCDTYELIQRHYVDVPDDGALAAGAVRGLSEFEPETSIASVRSVSCALPSPDFDIMCDSLTTEQGRNPAPVSDRVEAAVRGMVAFGLDDPHSVYLSPEAVERLRANESGEVEGIGAFVTTEGPQEGCSLLLDSCRLTIVGTISGSPAEQANLREGDVIVGVDGVPVEGSTVDEVVALVRGPAGSEVTLSILRDETEIQVTLRRAALTIPVVEHELLEPGIGYLRLAVFAEMSPDQVRAALEDLIDAGARQLIFDLQNNPGGALDAAVQIASEFLSGGLVLRTESPAQSIEYEVRPGGIATDPSLEVVVLINDASASASEVVAAVLQESGRATIIGEPSFGKNTVQRQFPLDNGGALKLTVARWVTPNRLDYGGTGVHPDLVVELTADAAPEVLIEAARAYLHRA
jgi:carboxyl-terminal processing protease